MGNLSIKLRLRPIRFAFLVRPGRMSAVKAAFVANTCLWGGVFNPMIPIFSRVPDWWDRKRYRSNRAKQIVNGYLDFFEPDYLVETEAGLAKGLNYDPDRVLSLDSLYEKEESDWDRFGLSSFYIYKHLYEKTYQFQRRHKHKICHVFSKDPLFKGFAACVFGGFPTANDLTYLKKAYLDAFDPASVALTDFSLLRMYENGYSSPLNFTSEEVRVTYQDQSDPALFIMDASNSVDLIDFWNLRAIHRNILPIPYQWIEVLSPFCRGFILKNLRPIPGNQNGVLIRPHCVFSRSFPEDKVKDFHQNFLSVDQKEGNVVQVWYPPIWKEQSEMIFSPSRPILESKEASINVKIDPEEPSASFPTLDPDFSKDFLNINSWANVILLEDWTGLNSLATSFPTEYRNPVNSGIRLGRDHFIPSTEGFVVFPEYKNSSEYWTLPSGTAAISSWLKAKGIKSEPSDAGRATDQIIQTMGGFWGVSRLAFKGIVTFLNSTSRSLTKSVHCAAFRNKIEAATSGDPWGSRCFSALVDKGAVKIGVEVRCAKCLCWSWYSLSEINDVLKCERCLRTYPFPSDNPTSSNLLKWSYRLAGPFALPDYAKGGYASSLTIRFFSEALSTARGAKITWSSGLNLTFEGQKSSEVDFLLWYCRSDRGEKTFPTETVFGEAKSFGNEPFEERDIDRMKRLAEAFPCSIFVFSTMKEASEFSREEMNRLRRFALWGREYDKERRRSRAPVIILTGTELFSSYSIKKAWENAGGDRENFTKKGYIRFSNLRVFADLTQQVYLGLIPYHEWLRRKWEKKTKKPPRSCA